ncbi:helix-turn-helix domain-containing protein [Patescibacteria group bacterium]|nr:helix-turn-helix domain-containing protein [Patescibacteria group bacterium]
MEQLLTLKEVTEILRVSERTIYRYIDSGELKAIKIGQWRFSQDDLSRFIFSKKNNGSHEQ